LGGPTKATAPDGSETMMTYQGPATVETNDKGQMKTTVKNTRGLNSEHPQRR
jgi:hypothetical protein